MFTSLYCGSTARGSVITIIQSLPIRNCLLYICSAELISNNLKSKTYILLPRNTCFHGSPDLPSYQTFNYKLNLMPEAISELVRQLIHSFKPQDCGSMKSLVDPMPIITCSGKNRAGKMSTEITSRGYYSTKNVYYFGLKLHVVAFRRKGIIPFFLKCLYFPLRMKMTQLYCIQKSKVWEIRTIEKYMPIKYIQIYYSIKRRKNAKNFRYLLL